MTPGDPFKGPQCPFQWPDCLRVPSQSSPAGQSIGRSVAILLKLNLFAALSYQLSASRTNLPAVSREGSQRRVREDAAGVHEVGNRAVLRQSDHQ